MNTIENKSKFFAQYWGQKVGVSWIETGSIETKKCLSQDASWLELKPLSSITDEDAIEIAKIFRWENGVLEAQVKTFLSQYMDYHNSNISSIENFYLCDYLRSKGYALPWLGISVEDQIEYGWIKLIQE